MYIPNSITTALTWILFFGLFPMAFLWLRRAWRIFINKDYSEVALKHGESPEHPEKWAIHTGVVNLAAGGTALFTIIGIFGAFLNYETWSAMAGITLWMKLIADFIVSRMAHPIVTAKNKTTPADK